MVENTPDTAQNRIDQPIVGATTHAASGSPASAAGTITDRGAGGPVVRVRAVHHAPMTLPTGSAAISRPTPTVPTPIALAYGAASPSGTTNSPIRAPNANGHTSLGSHRGATCGTAPGRFSAATGRGRTPIATIAALVTKVTASITKAPAGCTAATNSP